jgi:aminopeptidase N
MTQATAVILAMECCWMSPAAATSYDLKIHFEVHSGIAISGLWSMPLKDSASSEWSFFLSPAIGGLKLDRITCGKSRLRLKSLVPTQSGGDTSWKLTTATPCAARTPIQLAFHYRVIANAPQLQVTQDAAFAGGFGEIWYPQESFKILDTALLHIDTPVGFRSIATGERIGSVRHGNRIESSFRATIPAKLAFAIGKYVEAATSTPFPTRLLAVPPAPDAAKKAVGLSALLAPLETAFGPAPQRTLALVEVKFGGKVAGTSEYGMIFAERSQIVGPLDAPYWAHEFSHQWWGLSVRAASGTSGAVLLTEGMAQYGASLALEATQGRAAAAEYRRIDKKDSLEAYQRIVRAQDDRPLVGKPPDTDDEVLRLHHLATSKGAILLSQLQWLVGKAKFQRILQSFLAAHRGSSASWSDLQDAIDAGTNNTYKWWFDQWLDQAGAPSFRVTWRISGPNVTVSVHQETAKPYRLLIPIRMCGPAGAEDTVIESSSVDTTVRLTASHSVGRLLVDPDMLVPNLDPGAVAAVRQHVCA